MLPKDRKASLPPAFVVPDARPAYVYKSLANISTENSP